MSELQLIESVLARTERRRRWEHAFRGLWQGLLIGAIIWCAAVLAHKLFPTPVWTLTIAAALCGVSIFAGAIAGGWRKHSVSETARWVDGHQHLQERLSTALELARASGSETWRQLLVTDAASHLKEIDPNKLIRFRMSKASRWAIALLALGIGLGLVPEYRTKAFVQKQNEQKTIKEVGRDLVVMTKQTLSNRPPVMETTQKSMDAVNDLGDQFTKKAITRDQALKDLAKMSDRIKDEIKDMAKDPALRRMEQAARSHADNSSDGEQLQKQIAEAEKKLAENTATPEQMEKMENELSKLEAAAKAEVAKNGEMSQATKEKLSQSLAAMSKQAQSLGMNMPSLDQAVQALAESQPSMFLQDIKASQDDLQKMAELAKSLQQLQQQQTEKLGKDLAEQLKNGQPEAAQRTLQKMIDQLKSGTLSQEQMSKMMSEVSKAVDPGSMYGKAGDFLKQAAQQMAQGQKPGAAQSLDSASKELDRLMQQMGDAKSLMAELDELNKAEMGVGECNNPWGTKPGMKTGIGKGGKPGRGVGTWADENGGWGYNGQQTGLWDNSGLTRPDMAGKGQTDRGDGELSDALKPTQLKGQFSQGGPMPSITLKGVSIKGTSKVNYEEQVVAAQSEAQSALSQEKVPRAYRDSVRDYFDDLKK